MSSYNCLRLDLLPVFSVVASLKRCRRHPSGVKEGGMRVIGPSVTDFLGLVDTRGRESDFVLLQLRGSGNEFSVRLRQLETFGGFFLEQQLSPIPARIKRHRHLPASKTDDGQRRPRGYHVLPINLLQS